MNRKFLAIITSAAATHLAMPAYGQLLDRGPGLIYDSDLDITWLANKALTLGTIYDDGESSIDGRLSQASAISWASNLTYAGYSDWRLPIAPKLDGNCSHFNGSVNYGFNCTAGELGHLFYTEFGASAGQSASQSNSQYLGLFGEIEDKQSTYGYWIDSPWCCSHAPFFVMASGELAYGGSDNGYYVWAVRDGDVSMVPETSSLLCLLFGLPLLISYVHRWEASKLLICST